MTALLRLLHLCDSLFPIGAFAYSDGLEAAAARGLVTGADDLAGWLRACREDGFGRTDAPAMVLVWSALEREDWDIVIRTDGDVTALRPSASMRIASRSMGLRLLKTWQELHPHEVLDRLAALARADRIGPALPVAFAAAGHCSGAAIRETLAGYAYTRLAATVSAAMRLIAIGQSEAHRLLSRALSDVPQTIDDVLAGGRPPMSFAPHLDVAQMTQQYAHSRLFRS